MNQLDPAELRTGKLSGVKGGTSDPTLFDDQFDKQYVVEAPHQGSAVVYDDPEALTSKGLSALRRLTMADMKDDPASASRVLLEQLKKQNPKRYADLPDNKFGADPLAWNDADVQGVDDLATRITKTYPGRPGSWVQNDLRKAAGDYGKGYAREKEVLFDQPFDLKGARITNRKTGESFSVEDFLKKHAPEPEQAELPGVPEPEYNYHATPQSNATSIAELGLRPEQGGKNFAFKKNQGQVYMSGPDDAPMWADKLKDFSGEDPLELRTTAPASTPEGANRAVKTRTEPVAPERIQYKSPEGWRPVKELRPAAPAAASGMSPEQLKWWLALLGIGSAASAAKSEKPVD